MNATQLMKFDSGSVKHQLFTTIGDTNFVIPAGCYVIEVDGCGPGAGGGGGHVTGGGGGGGGGGTSVRGIRFAVTPGETLTASIADGTAGAAVGAGATNAPSCYLKRGGTNLLRLYGGFGGAAGGATVGGTGGSGAAQTYSGGGAGATDANGAGAVTPAYTDTVIAGSGAGGGTYSSNSTARTGGAGARSGHMTVYSTGGSTLGVVGGGAGGGGGSAWPEFYPNLQGSGIPGSGGNDSVVGGDALGYGAGGGGGGRNAAGGKGKQGFIAVYFR